VSSSIDLASLWTAAGVLLGFQTYMIVWRVERELLMESKALEDQENPIVWLPMCDYLNLTSAIVTAVGVFAAPALDISSETDAREWFGLSIILLVGYAFSLLGHYRLYKHKTPRPFFPAQEVLPFFITCIASLCYVVWIFVRAS
jgi:hypothetical protein